MRETFGDDTSYYADGQFSIRVPVGFLVYITKESDGSGDFRAIHGEGDACLTLNDDFVNNAIAGGSPALTVVQEEEIMLFDGEDCTGTFVTIPVTDTYQHILLDWFTTGSANIVNGGGPWNDRIVAMRVPYSARIFAYEHGSNNSWGGHGISRSYEGYTFKDY